MEEEQYTEELTFKKIWEKIKVSGVRIIVYVLIGLILGTAVLGVTDIVMSKSQFETSITYYYSGIEDGVDPWGGQMSLVNNIRTSSNVRNALAKCGYDEETIDKLVGEVISNLSVIPTVSDEQKDENEEVVSASYNYRIILAQNSAIDKLIGSKNEYNTIVSAITEEYINTFKANFSMATKLSAIEKIAEGSSINAMKELDILSQDVNTLVDESAMWQAKAGDFISSSQKKNFPTLTSQVKSLATELSGYNSTYIRTKAINGNGERAYIEERLAASTAEKTAMEKQVEILNEALKNARPLVSQGTSQEPIVVQNTEKLQEEISNASKELANAIKNEETWTSYKNAYDAAGEGSYANMSEEQQANLYKEVIANVNRVIDKYNALLESYKGMIKDYNEGYAINTSLVRMTTGARQTTDSPLSTMRFIILLAVVVVIAVIIAMCVTAKKGAMRIKFLEKKKAQDDAEQAVAIESAEVADEGENKAE